MGDVGALALGAALGTIAVIVRQEIVLFIMGGVFVVETLSVMIQVALVQADRQARLPHGADASPLRAQGLEGEPGRRALLDHHHAARAVRSRDAEAADEATTLALPRRRRARRCSGSATTGLSLARYSCAHGARRARRRHARRSAARASARGRAADVPLDDGPFTDATLAGADLIAISPGVAAARAGDRAPPSRAASSSSATSSSSRARCRRRRRCSRSPAPTARRTVDRADRRAVPRRRPRDASSPATSATRCSMRSPRTKRRAPWPRRVRARAVELPARDDDVAAAASPRRCSTSRANHLDRYAGIDDYAAAKARIFAQATAAGPQSRRSAIVRDAHARAAPCRRSAQACRSGGGMGLVERARRRRGSRAAARCLPTSRACARRTPQRAERARGAGARVVGREDRPPRCSTRSRAFAGCRTGCSASPTRAASLFVDDSKGTTVARDAGRARRHRHARSS